MAYNACILCTDESQIVSASLLDVLSALTQEKKCNNTS